MGVYRVSWGCAQACNRNLGVPADSFSAMPKSVLSPGNRRMASEPIDILALQNRLRIAVPRHLDHGAADLLGRGHVIWRQTIEQRQQRRSNDIDRMNPCG